MDPHLRPHPDPHPDPHHNSTCAPALVSSRSRCASSASGCASIRDGMVVVIGRECGGTIKDLREKLHEILTEDRGNYPEVVSPRH